MKNFKKKKDEYIKIKVEKLIDWNEGNGEGCIVSDRITKEGFKVGYMYRENPSEGNPDSGWRFLAGNEDEVYMNDSDNHHVFAQPSIEIDAYGIEGGAIYLNDMVGFYLNEC